MTGVRKLEYHANSDKIIRLVESVLRLLMQKVNWSKQGFHCRPRTLMQDSTYRCFLVGRLNRRQSITEVNAKPPKWVATTRPSHGVAAV